LLTIDDMTCEPTSRSAASARDAPLVSVGISVFNGERFLAEALVSLLGQDYPNLEIVVLDNRSDDGTAAICRRLAQGDSRLRFIVDDQRRDVVAGQKRVFELTRGEYFMVACDDDVYEPTYVSRLVELMRAHDGVVVAYAGHGHIYPDGRRREVVVPRRFFMSASSRPSRNFARYFWNRFPVPLVFGVVRAEAHREALRYYHRVDAYGWDHDNLYVLRLLTLGRAVGTPEVLFHYRQRDRSDQVPALPGGVFREYLCKVSHQAAISRVVFRMLRESRFSRLERLGLRVSAAGACAWYCTYKYAVGTRAAAPLKRPMRWIRAAIGRTYRAA
jgi:glycosyltransferase involved in cell wall biosynthesis